jgi:ABC-2 type transport system ATP-binding protein
MIEAHEVVKSIGGTKVLDNFEISVRKGTLHALVGPNGSGKSTVMKILSTDMKADSGSITINDVPIERKKEIRSMIKSVQDFRSLSGFYSPRHYLAGAGSDSKLPKEEIKYRVEVLAETLELTRSLDKKVGNLSDGMKRRVTLGMALIGDSSVLLMDGSLSDLDPIFCMKFMCTLRELDDKTVLLTTNNIRMVDRVCDGMTIISGGTTLLDESMTSIREKIGRPSVTFRVSPLEVQKLAGFLRQYIFANAVYVKDDEVTIEVDNTMRIPRIIRDVANIVDLFEVRQTMTDLDDLYNSFVEPMSVTGP